MSNCSSLMTTIDKLIKGYIKRSSGKLPDPDWVTTELVQNHSEIVSAWLDEHYMDVVRNYAVVKRMGAFRSTLTRKAQSGNLDDVEPEVLMATPFHVPGVGWKTFGKMTGSDHEAVAQAYERIHDTAQKRAILHRALAKEVGKGTTDAKFKPDQLMARVQKAYGDSYIPPMGQLPT